MVGGSAAGHLLPHHLLERAVVSAFAELKDSFGFGSLVLDLFFLELIDVWF